MKGQGARTKYTSAPQGPGPINKERLLPEGRERSVGRGSVFSTCYPVTVTVLACGVRCNTDVLLFGLASSFGLILHVICRPSGFRAAQRDILSKKIPVH